MNNLDGNKGMERGVNEVTYISRLENKVKNLELQLKEKFEEEFEDEIEIENYEDNCREDVILNKKDLVDLIRKYFSLGEYEFRQKVRIKARKGKIVIERIEE